jgi:hypothetical protein
VQRCWPDELTHFFDVLLVLKASVDGQGNVEHAETDDRQIDGFVLHEIGIGKDIAPIDRGREHEKSTGEARQMSGEALRLTMIGRRSDLESVGLPAEASIEVVTAGCVRTNAIVRREVERRVRDGRIRQR